MRKVYAKQLDCQHALLFDVFFLAICVSRRTQTAKPAIQIAVSDVSGAFPSFVINTASAQPIHMIPSAQNDAMIKTD